MTEQERIAKGLSEAQIWAIHKIAEGRATSPSDFGQAMMERPGAMGERKVQYKAQGYGRMGGTMMARLERKGLIALNNYSMSRWHPTTARLTPLGLAVRQHLESAQ